MDKECRAIIAKLKWRQEKHGPAFLRQVYMKLSSGHSNSNSLNKAEELLKIHRTVRRRLHSIKQQQLRPANRNHSSITAAPVNPEPKPLLSPGKRSRKVKHTWESVTEEPHGFRCPFQVSAGRCWAQDGVTDARNRSKRQLS